MALREPVYLRPSALDEVLELLGRPGAVVLSGGTDFFPERLYLPRTETVVDISDVAALRGITRNNDTWRFGAATTWREVREADLPPAFDGLRRAASQVGGVQMQNAGTVGGNLCTASPAGDGIPPLLTLGALVELRSSEGTRVLALEEFITGYRHTALRRGELVASVLVPNPPDGARGAFVKIGVRAHLVISIVMVAVVTVVDAGVITDARVAVGACSPVAQRLGRVEEALTGCPHRREAVDAALATAPLSELSPIDDVRSSAGYRTRVVRQLVSDAVFVDAT